MKYFLMIVITCWAELNFAQQVSITNQRTIGGNMGDELSQIIPAIDGGFILAGSSDSDISGEKTENSRGSYDFWILKCDSSLNIQWQKTIGGNANDFFNNMITTNDSSYLCAGISRSPISGDKTCDTIGGDDIWLIKIDWQGNILWQKTYGGTGKDNNGILLDNGDNTYFIAATSDSDSSGTKTENSRGEDDYWVTKIDSAGNIIWDRTIGGSLDDYLIDGVIDIDGNIYLAGGSYSDISGEKTENGYGMGDCWVVKLDGSGNIIWDKTFGGANEDAAISIKILSDNIYISATSSSDISGTKTENSRGYYDYWIIKINSLGNIIWDKTFGGTSYDNCFSSIVDQDGLIITGSSLSPISGEKNENSKGAFDYWIIKIDTNKNIIWQKDIGGSDYDEYPVTIKTGTDTYYTGGISESNISGDKTENSRGSYDFWVVGLSVTVGLNPIYTSNQNITVYPNPATNQLTIMSSQSVITNIKILDITGKLMLQTTFYHVIPIPHMEGEESQTLRFAHRDYVKVNIKSLPTGLYILKVTGDKGTKVTKFVKK